MSAAFRAAGAIAGVASGNITLALPAGLVDGDLMLAMTIGDDAVAVSKAGWINFATVDSTGATLRGQSLWRIAASESGSQVFTHTAGSTTDGLIAAFSGADQTTPVNASNVLGSSGPTTAITTNSITPTVDGCLIVVLFLMDNDANSASGYSNTGTALSWTENVDVGDSSTAFKRIAIATALQTTAAAIVVSATSGASANYTSILLAIAPASTAPVGPPSILASIVREVVN